MIYKGFKISNERAYVWRLALWGSCAHHNWIASWHIEDSEGKRVAGGHYSGNNTKSGFADIPRRKDAKAWVDGYRAYHDNPSDRRTAHNGHTVHRSTEEWKRDGRDEDQQAFFESGYHRAYRETLAKTA